MCHITRQYLSCLFTCAFLLFKCAVPTAQHGVIYIVDISSNSCASDIYMKLPPYSLWLEVRFIALANIF